MLCWLVVTLNVVQVEAKSSKIFTTVKSNILYALSYIREPNEAKIRRALAAKEAIFKISQVVHLGISEENLLLKNVQALGFDKKNALAALRKIDAYYAAMQAVENRYASLFTPWNKTEEMKSAVTEIAPFLQLCKLYKIYFEEHKDCLKGWELVVRYESVPSVDITDVNATVAAISLWYKNNDAFNLIKSVDLLIVDIVYIKNCLMKKSYQQAYADLYKQLYDFLPTLECVVDQVKQSSEYKSQWFYKTNKPSSPYVKKIKESPKGQPCVQVQDCVVVPEPVSVNHEVFIDHEQMIGRTDPFENNPY